MSDIVFSPDAELGNDHSQEIPLSVTDHYRNAFPLDSRRLSWPKIVAIYERFSRHAYPSKESAPLISPTIFRDGHRCNASAIDSGMVKLDTDGGNVSIADMVMLLREHQLAGIVYSSSRNRPKEPRWRLIIPLAENVPASHDVPRTIYRALAGMMDLGPDRVWKVDTSKFAPSSLFYVPGSYQTAVSDDGERFEPVNEFHHARGDIMPLEAWTAIADELSPLAPPPPPERERMEHPNATYEDIESAVAVAENDLDYLEWKKIAAAIMDGGGDFRLFDEFSRKWPGYDRLDTERAWSQLTRSPMRSISVGTLFDLAKRSDPSWISPSRKRAREESPPGKHLHPTTSHMSKPWWQRELETDVEAEPADNAAGEHRATEDDRTDHETDRRPGLGRNAFDLINRTIPPRQWLLGTAYCRRYLSSTIGEGATGKTTLLVLRSVALSSGQDISSEHIFQRCRVLYLTLEDDLDELARRVQACCRHHEVEFSDLGGWLFLDAITNGTKLTKADKHGNRIEGDLKEKLVEVIDRLGIDLVILDPFVKAHGAVSENDNAAIDRAASVLTDLCVTKNVAVDAPHHMRKGGGGEPGNADTARGGSAFKDAVRLGYTLTRMSAEEAKSYGVAGSTHAEYVRWDSGKVNIAKGGEKKWFHIVGENLGNGDSLYPSGDTIQVMEPWTPPDMLPIVEDEAFRSMVLDAIRNAPKNALYSNDPKAEERHIRHVMQDAMPTLTKDQCQQIIETWMVHGHIGITEYKDAKSRDKKGLAVRDKMGRVDRPPQIFA